MEMTYVFESGKAETRILTEKARNDTDHPEMRSYVKSLLPDGNKKTKMP
jgi:hypothetical protein